MAYLIGALRDGSLVYDKSRNYKTIWYENNNDWLMNSIVNRVQKVFKKKPRLDQYKKGHFRVVLSSKNIFYTIKNYFGFIAPQEKWCTPEPIKKSNDEIIASYIAGFFDAEGDMNPKKYMMGFSQKNQESLSFIKMWLNEKNIKTSKIFIADKKSNTKRFYITKKSNFEKFYRVVKFEHPNKIMRVRLLLQQT